MSILSWQKAQRYPGGVIKYLYDVAAGNETGDSALASRVDDVETTIGKATGEGAGGILKDVKDVKDAIGTESTEGSILARIKALEDKP